METLIALLNNDIFVTAAGLGIGMLIIATIIYLGIIALCLWIGYLIMRTAVKNGMLRADAEIQARHGRSSAYFAPPRG